MAFETCPMCGYRENKPTTGVTNHMNEYVDAQTGKVFGVMNSNEEKITLKSGIVVVRKDKYSPPAAPVTPVTPPKK